MSRHTKNPAIGIMEAVSNVPLLVAKYAIKRTIQLKKRVAPGHVKGFQPILGAKAIVPFIQSLHLDRGISSRARPWGFDPAPVFVRSLNTHHTSCRIPDPALQGDPMIRSPD